MVRRALLPLLLLGALSGVQTAVRAGTVVPELLPDGQRLQVGARFTAGRETVTMEGRLLFSGVREVYLASADVVALLRLGRYWDPDRRRLTLRAQGPVCELTAGSRLVRIDGRDHLLALPPVALDGDLWLPMECLTRLLAPALDEPLTWDADALILRFGGPRRNVLEARIDTGARSTTLRLRCGEPLSFRAVAGSSGRILLRVYGGVVDGQTLRRTQARGLISALESRQADEYAEITISLGSLAGGFDAHAEDGGRLIVLTVAEAPTGALPDPTIRGSLGMAAPAVGGERSLRRVVIDPGHGGLDEGRHGQQGRLEKDVVLRLARDLRDALRARGFETLLTRGDFIGFAIANYATPAPVPWPSCPGGPCSSGMRARPTRSRWICRPDWRRPTSCPCAAWWPAISRCCAAWTCPPC